MKIAGKKGSPKEPSETCQVGMHENEGRGSERVIADDLVVSSTPRRIRRTSNSSADRYRVPGGLARKGGLRQGARGGRSNEEGGKRDGGGKGVAEWVSAEENERWCLWGAGGGVARTGTPRGCFYDDGNYRQGWLAAGGNFPLVTTSLSLGFGFSFSLSLLCGELLILATPIPPLVHAKGFLFLSRRWGRVSRIGTPTESSSARRGLAEEFYLPLCGTKNR